MLSIVEKLKTIRINMASKSDTIMHIATVIVKGKKNMHSFLYRNK